MFGVTVCKKECLDDTVQLQVPSDNKRICYIRESGLHIKISSLGTCIVGEGEGGWVNSRSVYLARTYRQYTYIHHTHTHVTRLLFNADISRTLGTSRSNVTARTPPGRRAEHPRSVALAPDCSKNKHNSKHICALSCDLLRRGSPLGPNRAAGRSPCC